MEINLALLDIMKNMPRDRSTANIKVNAKVDKMIATLDKSIKKEKAKISGADVSVVLDSTPNILNRETTFSELIDTEVTFGSSKPFAKCCSDIVDYMFSLSVDKS